MLEITYEINCWKPEVAPVKRNRAAAPSGEVPAPSNPIKAPVGESQQECAQRRQSYMNPVLDEAFGSHTGYTWAKEAGLFVGEAKTVSRAAEDYLNGKTGRLRKCRKPLEEAIHRRRDQMNPKVPFTRLPD